ncbi:MAG: sugar phosphate isomerase/epimerase family protein [Phycisphaeraceae bacterium]
MAYLATIAAFGFPDIPQPQTLALFAQLGCRRCQFYRNENQPPTTDQALALARDAGLTFDSIHGLFGVKYDPSSPDESKRRIAVETYQRESELALALGADMVVVHPAAPWDDKDGVLDESQRAARIAPLHRSLEALAHTGERTGVTFLIENIPATYAIGHDPAALADILRQFNHPRIRMCFDTGHAHMTANVPQALHDCADMLAYLHVHDNDATVDDHRIPGDGTIDWPAVGRQLAQMRPDLPAMLELFQDQATFRRHMAKGLRDNLHRWLAIHV